MSNINETPIIKDLFKDENLISQPVYKSKEKYNVVYVNSKLYEEIFEEEYSWNVASEKISNIFSVTLDKERSNGEIEGEGFPDKQLDPSNMSLSGNLGSGRAYFYKKYFNIKGHKTNLATAPKSIYSNGKYALSAAIRETVIANILAKDFLIPTFQTIAILDMKEKFDFIDEYMDIDDVIKQEKFNLPCAIEIRVNKDKELYRISNSLINKDTYTKENIEELCEKLAIIEANKFSDRFLHGSWSVGNISTDGNLIDFDTAYFVKGRHPQYSNTNKYKSNYFGYEILGQKFMLDLMVENTNLKEGSKQISNRLQELIDKKYKENILIRFCDLIGLDYDVHYKEYSKNINNLCERFNILSRKLLPNYYDTNVVEENCDFTNIFDFSRFFQKFLIEKEKHSSIMFGLKLLLNEIVTVKYSKVGMIKDKVEEFFKPNIVNNTEEEINEVFNQAMDFIIDYNQLFQEVSKKYDLESIKFKSYIINANRDYLYGKKKVYADIANLYETNNIDSYTLNKIINALIKTNKRNYDYRKQNECLIGLRLYKDCLTYFVVSPSYYYLVIEPYSDFEMDFAKIIIDGEQLMVKHYSNEGDNIMISERVGVAKFSDILSLNLELKINGKTYNKSI